jgi:hypothetical protein
MKVGFAGLGNMASGSSSAPLSWLVAPLPPAPGDHDDGLGSV